MKILKKLFLYLLSIFFDPQKIRGKHFEENLSGYKWALKSIWTRNILRIAPPAPWPITIHATIYDYNNVIFHPDDLNNFQSFGVYWQNFSAKIYIGYGTYIGPNVGLITAQHEIDNLDTHTPGKDIVLGKHCWIGMNSIIMPGVIIGDRTIIGAGSIVTRSFPDGDVTVAGNPAKIIKKNSEK